MNRRSFGCACCVSECCHNYFCKKNKVYGHLTSDHNRGDFPVSPCLFPPATAQCWVLECKSKKNSPFSFIFSFSPDVALFLLIFRVRLFCSFLVTVAYHVPYVCLCHLLHRWGARLRKKKHKNEAACVRAFWVDGGWGGEGRVYSKTLVPFPPPTPSLL